MKEISHELSSVLVVSNSVAKLFILHKVINYFSLCLLNTCHIKKMFQINVVNIVMNYQ